MKQSEIVELVYRAMPNSNHIKNLDLDSEKDAIIFEWAGQTFRIGTNLFCEEVVNDLLHSGGSVTILIEALLRKCMYK